MYHRGRHRTSGVSPMAAGAYDGPQGLPFQPA